MRFQKASWRSTWESFGMWLLCGFFIFTNLKPAGLLVPPPFEAKGTSSYTHAKQIYLQTQSKELFVSKGVHMNHVVLCCFGCELDDGIEMPTSEVAR